MKYFLTWMFFTILFTSCSNKYISQVPFKYSYKDDAIKRQFDHEKEVVKNESIVNDNPENLSDDILRLKEKYAIITASTPNKITNYKLYQYVDEWIGTPNKDNSLSKDGLDCAYFLQSLMTDVYGVTLPKNPAGMFKSKSIQLFTGRAFLAEGDLIFFRYDKNNPISDVGLYLNNDRILACTSNGFNIYNFNEDYFQLRYVASGRVIKEAKK
ncbi:MAG TPA: NlpC/P60 family protein [Flavobacterium sp.]